MWSPRNVLSFDEVTYGSKKVAMWMCPKEHTWEAPVYRVSGGAGCGVCAGKVIQQGVNDLSTTHPNLAKEFHTTNIRKLSEIGAGSGHKVDWKCSDCGHVWSAPVWNRTHGNGCPACANLVIIPGNNDLATTHPDLAAQWSSNNSKSSQEVVAGSTAKYEWICPENHTWKAAIHSRTLGSGCPYCARKRALPGVSDLTTTHPDLAKQWSTRNTFPVTTVSAGSGKRAWWSCSNGHEWDSIVSNYVQAEGRCPICLGKRTLEGFNDLASLRPDLLTEWDESNTIRPTDITVKSCVKATWKCVHGHKWVSQINTRVNGSGCPYCSGHRPIKGVNDVLTVMPSLLSEWDSSNKTRLDEVTSGSDVMMKWVCKKGHTWSTAVKHRVLRGSSCPTCSASVFVSKREKELVDVIRNMLPEEKIETSFRGISGIRELDIWIPQLNTAIEFNGVYYHSERFRDNDYHYNKWKMCNDKGIYLIQVWEDDWVNSRYVVERMLKHKLGISTDTKFGARLLTHHNVSYKDIEPFMEYNHIQGATNGTFYDALKSSDNIIRAALITTKVGKRFTIDRYATCGIISGGFGKLLKVLEHRIRDLGGGELVTFADLSHSSGNLYKKNGFIQNGIIPPDYSYLKAGVREHKFKYRISRFKNDPNLVWEEGLTERKLAEKNNLLRVYDSGKLRFTKQIPAR